MSPVQGVSDLAIVATASPVRPWSASRSTYTITVSNQGPDDEPDAAFAASLPAGMTRGLGDLHPRARPDGQSGAHHDRPRPAPRPGRASRPPSRWS